MARDAKPSIIFIDEVDSLCGSRSEGENDSSRRIKTEFLVQMQGTATNNDGVLVLGATNVPWELDNAIRRRFQKRVHIGLPESPARAGIFKIRSGKTKTTIDEQQYAQLGDASHGYSGSDIANVVNEALMLPVRRC
jgi:vacuolar protein-sorting-associated protein 4